MRYVRPFDPWKFELCTCPEKYSFNPYTGCSHGCVYCYAVYIPNFRRLRVKRDLFRTLERDLKELPENSLISMSNSSDPYPPEERVLGVTRRCLEIMRDYDVRLLIVTKGDIVTRDLDILSEMRCAVSVSVTSLETSRVIEPNAPSPERRIGALREVKEYGIPAVLRLDPVIPFITEDEAERVLRMCDFVDHVVISTLKLGRGIRLPRWMRERLRGLYVDRIRGHVYARRDVRIGILRRLSDVCEEMGLSYSYCREGLEFKAKSCDGSHLIT